MLSINREHLRSLVGGSILTDVQFVFTLLQCWMSCRWAERSRSDRPQRVLATGSCSNSFLSVCYQKWQTITTSPFPSSSTSFMCLWMEPNWVDPGRTGTVERKSVISRLRWSSIVCEPVLQSCFDVQKDTLTQPSIPTMIKSWYIWNFGGLVMALCTEDGNITQIIC